MNFFPVIFHFGCLLWSFQPFGVDELVSAFLLLKKYQNVDLATLKVFVIFLIGLFWFFGLMMVSFTCVNISLGLILSCSSEQQPNANLTVGVNSRSFIFLICHEITREQAMKPLVSQSSNELFKS